MLFGASGFILGPVLAALFLTVWEMFGIAFQQELSGPASAVVDSDPASAAPVAPGGAGQE